MDEFAYQPERLNAFDVDMDAVHPVRRQKKEADAVWLPFGMKASEGKIASKINNDKASEASDTDAPKTISDPETRHDDGPEDDDVQSSSEEEEDNKDKDKPKDPVDPPVHPVDPVLIRPKTGFISYGKAPSSKSVCFLCDTPIIVEEWRIEYRIRPSTAFKWCRYMHVRCVHAAPVQDRAHNRRLVEEWLSTAMSPEGQLMLDGLLDNLAEAGGAAGSSVGN